MADRLEKFLKFAEQNEHPDDEIDELKAKLKAATKVVENEQPPGILQGNMVKYLDRARNRVDTSREAVREAQAAPRRR